MEDAHSSNELQLPFTHGIEVELQIIRKDGSWIRGEEILKVFDRLVSSAKTLLDNHIRLAEVESVRRKYSHSSQTEEGERGSRVIASYQDQNGNTREYTLIGHDPNVTSLTWILEIATPPCTTLEELAWWIQTLIAISYESLPKDSKTILIATGLNPTQEYLKNLSFGEHHHILGPDVEDDVKLAVYNLIRNFIPHLIALSVNSPFENKSPTDEVRVDDKGRTRAPKCKRSIRLYRNTTQMGPVNEFELIPYVTKVDKEGFARHVNRSYARMVDMYPYTDYGTIELRVSDTQLSVPRRIGLALILQALALKAKRMIENGQIIPDVGASSLAANRESAIEAGLWGPFRISTSDTKNDFLNIYSHVIKDDGTINGSRRNRFMGDALISMLYFIRDELEELEAIDNPFLQPILVSIFGSELIEPKTTGADFQLDVYAKSDMNMVVLMKQLSAITRECCTNWLYDPLSGTPKLPTWMCWWKGITPEIITDKEKVIAGQKAEFTISIRNTLERPIENLSLVYSIEDSERHVINQEIISMSKIDAGEIVLHPVEFKTKKDISAYNIFVTINITGREIKLSSTINTYWLKASLKSGTTTQFADGIAPVFYSGEVETNYPMDTSLRGKISVLIPKKELIIAETNTTIALEAEGTHLFQHSDFPPLVIPSVKSEGVERCVLKFELLDEEGKNLMMTTSRPFYVGYVQRGPNLILHSEFRSFYKPGAILQGMIQLKPRGFPISERGKVKIIFLSDSGKRINIDSVSLPDLENSTIGFEWIVPNIESNEQMDRIGIIQLELIQDGKPVTTTGSNRFAIEYSEVQINIDSFRATEVSFIGGKVSGWLRLRRNTEQGDPASIIVSLIYPDGQTFPILSQTVKQSKNLSLSFGPELIPSPKGSKQPENALLQATLKYQGRIVDQRETTIKLSESEDEEVVKLVFSGIPGYTLPDTIFHSTISVSNNFGKKIQGDILIELETILGTENLLNQQIELGANQTRIFPFVLKIPIGAEMSTAYIKSNFNADTCSSSTRTRIKIKAIEEPLFHISYSIKNEDGKEVPGLVPRMSTISIEVKGETQVGSTDDLKILLRIMSLRSVVKQFEIPFPETRGDEFDTVVRWMTPPVDIVTGYYLETVIEHKGRQLPLRAIEQAEKQFTVY
ncbi:MAG: hypothetical protein ACTSUO_08710 [Candidatus Thorarchaeota archaeon]